MIPLFKVKMSPEAKKLVSEVLDSGFIGQGPKNEEFENLLKKRFNNSLILTLNSATSGLHLALHLLKKPYSEYTGSHSPWVPFWPGLNSDDEVLTCPLTCTATNWPIIHNNLKIKWVDADPNTCSMDLDDLERKLSPKTKVIIVVHWGGTPVDLNRIKRIQSKCLDLYGFKPAVIEDCAHAMGATWEGRPLGNHGNICVYSFQAIKHFTTGDGGCVIFPHNKLYRRAKLLRWYGIDRETNKTNFRCDGRIDEAGFKFHMNDINSAIGIANLPLIDETVKLHKDIAFDYNPMITNPLVRHIKYSEDSSYWVYTILFENKKIRDKVSDYLNEKGIQCSRVHERNDIHPCVYEYRCALPGVDKCVDTMLCIPSGWWITKEDRDFIVKTINEISL